MDRIEIGPCGCECLPSARSPSTRDMVMPKFNFTLVCCTKLTRLAPCRRQSRVIGMVKAQVALSFMLLCLTQQPRLVILDETSVLQFQYDRRTVSRATGRHIRKLSVQESLFICMGMIPTSIKVRISSSRASHACQSQ